MEYHGTYCVHFISVTKIFKQATQAVSEVRWETIHKYFMNSQIKALKFHVQLNNT